MFVFIVIIFVLFLFIYVKRLYSFWERRGFPFIPARFPLGSVGIVSFMEHASVYFQRHYEQFKDKAPAFGAYCIFQAVIAITDPELIKDVYTRNFESFHERGFFYNEKADPLSANLFSLGGKEWKSLRAKLTPTFTSGRMKMMFPLISKSADRLTDYLVPFAEKHEPLELKEVYSGFTTEVIASVAFGLDIECLGNPDSEFKDIARSIFNPNKREALNSFFVFTFPEVAKMLNMRLTPKDTSDFFMGVIRETMEYREKNKVERNDFLQLLINLKKSEDGLTFNEIAANSFIFFFAG
jgi:cytochrome P450 family 6